MKQQKTGTNTVPHFNSDVVFRIVNTLILVICFILVLYPVYFVVIASFSNPTMVNTGQVWILPKDVSIDGYSYVFKDSRLLIGYRNSIIYSFLYMFLAMALTIMAAYPLAQRNLYGRRVINFLIVLPMYFSGGLVPTYIVVKSLHMINTPLVIIILGALSGFNVIIARTFFENSIPHDLIEAAAIDGSNQAQSFWKIVLPLSRPILAVIGLYTFVGQWNAYFNSMMFLSDMNLYPLQLVLRQILIQGQSLQDTSRVQDIASAISAAEQQKLADMIKYCVIVFSSAPLLIIFPFFQKYFAQGMMIGAIKS